MSRARDTDNPPLLRAPRVLLAGLLTPDCHPELLGSPSRSRTQFYLPMHLLHPRAIIKKCMHTRAVMDAQYEYLPI